MFASLSPLAYRVRFLNPAPPPKQAAATRTLPKTDSSHLSFVFFLRSCGVVCDGNYSLKSAQGSGRGSFAEGCPSRKVAEGDVGEIQQIQNEFEYPDVAQFPCPVLEFDFDMNCSQVIHILRCRGLLTGFASVFRGSRAEASRKHRGRTTCPNNRTPRRCPDKVQAQDKRT